MKQNYEYETSDQYKKRHFVQQSEWYSLRSLLGNTWAFFYILLGGRETGKSYAVMDYFVYEWKTKHKPFTWLRLTEASQKKMLNNNAAAFVDADIARRFDLELTVKRKSSL